MKRTKPTDAQRNGRLDRELDEYSAAARTALTVTTEQERWRTPDHRLAVYSGVAGAALAGAFAAQAAVVYHSADITLNAATGAASQKALTFYGTSSATFGLVHRDNWAGNDRATVNAVNNGVIFTSGDEAIRFTKGQTIQGTAADIWGRVFSDASGVTGKPAMGQFWYGNTGYIGVRYKPGGGLSHYGWIHVDQVDNALESYHISGYAYQSTPLASIEAGEGEPESVPEPSTVALALLASGAAGLMRARRKKLLRGKKQG